MSSLIYPLIETDAQVAEREERRTIADPGANRGYSIVPCPVPLCGTKHRFRETDQTLKEARMTLARRERYLKMQHSVGRH